MSASKLFKTIGQSLLQSNENVKRKALIQLIRNYSASAYTTRYAEFETLEVSAPYDHVLHVQLNRPDKRNAMNRDLFREIFTCFSEINDDKQCRAVVLSGAGKTFSAGLDFSDMLEMMNHSSSKNTEGEDVATRAKFLRNMIILLQNSFNSIVKCPKPVIAAVHGGCIGAGLDLISAVDVRYCSNDAFFSIREVGIGMAADLGSLQRLPKIIGNDSLIRELAFTARNLPANEAKEAGLVSSVYADSETTLQSALELAKSIASNSPVAVQGSKIALNYSRDHSVRDGLEFMANWNMCMLQTEDMVKAVTATVTRSDTPPVFADL